MISKEKWMILTPLQKLPNNVGDFGKLIVATGFEWLPKVQKIAQSGHTGSIQPSNWFFFSSSFTCDKCIAQNEQKRFFYYLLGPLL